MMTVIQRDELTDNTLKKMFEYPPRQQCVLSELLLRVIVSDVTVVRAVAVTAVVLLVVNRVRGNTVVRRLVVLVQDRHASSAG